MENEKRLVCADELKALFDERYDEAFMQSHTRPNIAWWEGYSAGVNWARNTLHDMPTADAVEVVRCKDCKRYVDNREAFVTYCKRGNDMACVTEDHFCSYGERREGE